MVASSRGAKQYNRKAVVNLQKTLNVEVSAGTLCPRPYMHAVAFLRAHVSVCVGRCRLVFLS